MPLDGDDAADRRARLGRLLRRPLPAGSDVRRAGLQQVCRAAVDALDLSGAVVSLMAESDPGGGLGGEAIAASWGDDARAVEELQFSLGEGPGRDAFATRRPVLVPDLAERVGRWPGYAPAAVEAGVRSAFVFPLAVGALRLGVLSLYSSRPRTLGADEVADSLRLHEVAVRYLLDRQDGVDEADGPPLLRDLDVRDVVYQAQGMVMVALGVSLAEAFARMRAHAYAEGLDLNDLAGNVVAGRTQLSRVGDDT